ncbi:unnamed protein product [Gongylonema pulchrum]|uniref:Aa_trans domain-containing protein n=1 Tax=Gongylonema pulchrum TaxID=637853 RepID=A0A183CWM9_9BILA|nr:unnamed protein product [Gongylonema pulchrum]
MMLAIVFVAESLPTFGPLLDLVGGSTLTLTSLVFPCFFYMYLTVADDMAQEKGEKNNSNVMPTFIDVLIRTPKLRLLICLLIIGFGLVGSAAVTYTAIKELATTHFTAPCYVQPFLRNAATKPAESHLNCCGVWQNITRLGDVSECNPYRDFYSQA